MEIKYSFRLTDEEAKEIIYKISKCKNSANFQTLEKNKRDLCLQKFYLNGLSIRQISRLTGMSKKIVETNVRGL